MTTYRESTDDDILSALDLTPSDVPTLPAKVRDSLLGFLMRWEHYDAAHRCLQQLLVTHNRMVSLYDKMARVYLATSQPDRALEIMRRRHDLRSSNSSRALEAQAHLAAGDLASARAIAFELVDKRPDMHVSWSLQTDVCLAANDFEGAEAALRRKEALRPNMPATALGLAQLWLAQHDFEKALLWARTALARTDRDGRKPSVPLLRLLERLYASTSQAGQAEATSARLQRRRLQELDELRQSVDLAMQGPPLHPGKEPSPLPKAPAAKDAPGLIAGAIDLTADERARLDQALHHFFAHKSFRPGQADTVAAILRGESVLAVMPTGAGKSLCYQLASLLLPGTTLVISPLIALMKDQLDGLPPAVARQATTLNSTLDSVELDARLSRAAGGGYRMLYAAPERLRQRPFPHALQKAGVSLLVIDEAHCVSLWGHDFRPDYLFIAKVWRELGEPPILALTATATPRVRDDIQTALGQMRLIAADVHRPNLHLAAQSFSTDAQKKRALRDLCLEIEGSGIVYARSRKECEELAEMLRHNGMSAIHYHAGIDDRAATQDCFMQGQERIIVATIAFGMGVDKPDVRFIIHYSPPKSLENYYQEAGRAGRDGLPARCILFHTRGDRAALTRWSHQDALQIEFVRSVYVAIQRRLGPEAAGLVAVGDLERDLATDETRVRVAVHFLETAGLIWRGFDLPRTASIRLFHSPDDDDPDLARFVEAARLRPNQTVSRSLLDLSRDARLDPSTVEAQVLQWQDAGRLQYRGTGRDMLLALPDPYTGSRQRVAAMLADHRAGQDGRIAETMGYARTGSCRHGYISTYFGGRSIERCQACDNCLEQNTGYARSAQYTRSVSRVTVNDENTTLILQAVAQLPFPLDSTGLARALAGSPVAPVQADRFPLFGLLAGRTQKSISELILQLAERGLLAHFDKGKYRLLRLSKEGQDWLKKVPITQTQTSVPRESQVTTPKPVQAAGTTSRIDLSEHDESLLERLRAWRREVAKDIGMPPYIVFHNAVLQRIAAARPDNLDQLAAIKGIGPRKLEQYGNNLLDLIADHQAAPDDREPESDPSSPTPNTVA